jgi:hypothetical protein
MSGVKMTVDEMRKVILNPVTGLPLTRAKMYKYFRREMDEGPPSLKWLIAEKFMAHLNEGREYAVRLGLKNKHGWATEGAAPPPAFVLVVALSALVDADAPHSAELPNFHSLERVAAPARNARPNASPAPRRSQWAANPLDLKLSLVMSNLAGTMPRL